jgi:uncharacterized membrane protein (UPF0127 family)
MRSLPAPVLLAATVLVVGLAGCSKEETDGISSTHVSFPNGKRITVEIKRKTAELMTGMMFRDSLAEDRGMLFVNPAEDAYSYWMYQTRIPLDIIWMDRNYRIVEMSENTPPCTTDAVHCPKYGGTQKSSYVLEINAGQAAKNGLKIGDVLQY